MCRRTSSTSSGRSRHSSSALTGRPWARDSSQRSSSSLTGPALDITGAPGRDSASVPAGLANLQGYFGFPCPPWDVASAWLSVGSRLSVDREKKEPAMNWVALKMLTGDRAKYLGIVFGVAFATLLMAQQTSMFVGIMART